MEEIERIVQISPSFINQISLAATSKRNSRLDIAKEDAYCLTGGHKGIMRLWNVSSGREVSINDLDALGFQNKISDIFLTEDKKHLYLFFKCLLIRYTFPLFYTKYIVMS